MGALILERECDIDSEDFIHVFLLSYSMLLPSVFGLLLPLVGELQTVMILYLEDLQEIKGVGILVGLQGKEVMAWERNGEADMIQSNNQL